MSFSLPVPVVTVGLLFCSNLFMTIAWYGHLKYKSTALPVVILISWGIAFFEYCLQVPANRAGYGAGRHFGARGFDDGLVQRGVVQLVGFADEDAQELRFALEFHNSPIEE